MSEWQGGLWRRYYGVFRRAWAARHKYAPASRRWGEADFLPAVLEVQESPPHPLARATAYVVISFFIVALAWMILGKTDIVATAPGKVIPDGRIKVVQSAEGGVVRKILVADGDRVRAGQELFILDGTESGADIAVAEDGLLSAKLEEKMAALLSAPLGAEAPRLEGEDISPIRMARQQEILEKIYGEQRGRIAQLESEIEALRQGRISEEHGIVDTEVRIERHRGVAREKEEGVLLQIGKMEKLLPLAEEEYGTMQGLLGKGAVSKLQVRRAQEKYIALREDLSYRRNALEELRTESVAQETELLQTTGRHRRRVAEIEANLRAREEALLLARSSFRREMGDRRETALREIARYGQELVKIRELQKRRRILAPASGVVQQLALHTEDGVVQAAQALLVIVPENPVLEVEALVENKDIGFVREEQQAEIKIDAFPYTKYGLIKGVVSHLSADAVEDEKRGLVYQARIRLDADRITADGREIRLSPGMSVVAEIKTGKRRVIEFFLSPLLRHGKESLGER